MKVSVVGLGYIGLPTALLFARAGIDVVGVDVDPRKLTALRSGRMPFEEDGFQAILDEALRTKRFTVSDKPVPADAHILCVPSPIKADKTADMSYVEKATRAVIPVLRPGDLVILETTVPVHATRDHVERPIQAAGLQGILVSHCPETVIPGNILHEMVHNHRVVGGTTPDATRRSADLYRRVVTGAIYETDAATAEYVKLIENTYRDVNIALANELGLLGRQLGLDTRAAIRIANHHPRVHLHQPGPGVGGHCIPVDPWFLIEAAAESPVMTAARAMNDAMPARVAQWTLDRLHAQGIQPRQAKVAVLGLAYKGNVDDTRESPSLEIIHALRHAGATVATHDPHVAQGVEGNTPLAETLQGADAIVIATDHKAFTAIEAKTAAATMRHRILIDARSMLDPTPWRQAGFDVERY